MLGGQVLLAAQQVNNEDGKLIAGNRADLSVNQFNNQRGIVYSQGELSLKNRKFTQPRWHYFIGFSCDIACK